MQKVCHTVLAFINQLKNAKNVFFTVFNLLYEVSTAIIGTFRSDYDYENENEICDVHLARMRDSVSMSRKLVLSSKISSPSY